MAAVIPFLETQQFSFPDYGPEAALNGLGAAAGELTAQQLIAASNIEQTRLLYTRTLLQQALAGKTFQLKRKGNDIKIELSQAFDRETIPWARSSSNIKTISLFSTNSKMRCPTFDLPAGAQKVGGTCPGALPAQTTSIGRGGSSVDKSRILERTADGRTVLRMLPKVEFDLARAVCGYCVTGDTRVIVRGKGLVKVEDLVDVGDFEVWSGQEWRTTRAVLTSHKPTVEVATTWGAKIRLTADHRVLTKDGGWVEAGELEEGDTLVHQMPSMIAFPSESRLVTSLRGDGGSDHFNAVEERFPAQWSYDVGLFLGYLLGNGSIYRAKNGYDTVSLMGSGDDHGDIVKINNLVGEWCGTSASVKLNTPQPNGFSPDPKPISQVSWRVKSLVQFVGDCGLNKDAPPEVRTVPSGIWTASESAVKGFLSGIFSTDGSVCDNESGSKKVEVTLASVSRPMLEGVQQLLFAFGIRSNICAYETASRHREAQGYRRLWKLNIGAAEHVLRFAKEINFFSERKKARLEGALHICRAKKAVARHPHVSSVSISDKVEAVYDLINVGPEQQFVANGVTVHNCYATGGKYGEPTVQIAELVRLSVIKAALQSSALREVLIQSIVWQIPLLPYDRWLVGKIKKRDASGVDEDDAETAPDAEPTITAEDIETPEQVLARMSRYPNVVRIHSSGDFFSIKYAEMWLEIARRLYAQHGNRYILWAPTRTHVIPGADRADERASGFADFWAKADAAGQIPPNFVIRPSAYHLGDEAPMPPGLAAGTSVLTPADAAQTKGVKYDHQCGVYDLARGNKTCVDARAPDGSKGCRACWVNPQSRVNYVAH